MSKVQEAIAMTQAERAEWTNIYRNTKSAGISLLWVAWDLSKPVMLCLIVGAGIITACAMWFPLWMPVLMAALSAYLTWGITVKMWQMYSIARIVYSEK